MTDDGGGSCDRKRVCESENDRGMGASWCSLTSENCDMLLRLHNVIDVLNQASTHRSVNAILQCMRQCTRQSEPNVMLEADETLADDLQSMWVWWRW